MYIRLYGLFMMTGLASLPLRADDWKPAPDALPTRWAHEVSPQNALPEYPRPQMVRADWQSLNGLWDYAVGGKDDPHAPAYTGKILVPYPIESSLSGVGHVFTPEQRLFYHRSISVPASWRGRRVLLHFGAVDYEAVVSVNGKEVGVHRGGYDPFTFDVTEALVPGTAQEIAVGVTDPSDQDDQPVGKQKLHPEGIWYTPTSGIWQTVWMEAVPDTSIEELKLTPDVDNAFLNVAVNVTGPDAEGLIIEATPSDAGKTMGSMMGQAKTGLVLPVPRPHLWSPDDPHLYRLRVNLLKNGKVIDSVESYFAMRSIQLGKDDKGITRPMLNGKFVFEVGVLDQGFWPDGIYTAPTDAALCGDIETAKKLGFNLIRKHVKVEPQRWYYHADRLGMLVWQDMPAANHRTPESKTEFESELLRMVHGLVNHPSIIMWVPFNEGGEYDSARIVNLIREADPTRLVSDASGWNDNGFGDVIDAHTYPRPRSPEPEEKRFAAIGEFGGLSMKVPGHEWNPAKTWGYEENSGPDAFAKRYAELLSTAYNQKSDPGLSAVVYTQLTDVEIENTGLLTYDRQVVKPVAEIVKMANMGKFIDLPRYSVVVPASDVRRHTWRYTESQPSAGWMDTDFDDAAWKTERAPFGTGSGVSEWKGPDIWLRRQVEVTGPLPDNLKVFVYHDDDFEIYINGVLAASAPGFTTDYIYVSLSDAGREALHSGRNILAVHGHDTGGGKYIDAGIIGVDPEH